MTATMAVNSPGTSDVIWEITDGENVLIQLKQDGTLLLSQKIRIQYSDSIKSSQTEGMIDVYDGSLTGHTIE